MKTTQIGEYGYSDTSLSDYEEDHLIALELGGNPTSAANLWPEPHATVNGGSSSKKDTIENKLKKMVCAGTTTLAAARTAIAKNWTTALSSLSSLTAGSVAVTNPGSQTGTVGVSASLQVNADDTAAGTTSFAATGLPSGMSISSSTGLISGTPTTTGTYSPTVTASDSTGVSGTAGFTWKVSAAGVCTSAQLLGNPGFETGAATPWSATTDVINNDANEPANTGDWDAWLDGYGEDHTDTLSQAVAVPSGCASTFSYYLAVDTEETSTSTAYDTMAVEILNSAGTVLATPATYSNLDAGTTYAKHSISLSAYAGQTITVKFVGTEDYEYQTSFVVDDTSLTG